MNASAEHENNETVAERLAWGLKRHGVTALFAQSIPVALIQAASRIGIRQIGYRAENMGGAMADGFARMSGRIGVVTAQNGSAAALLVAPLAEALKASVPLLVIAQDIPLSTEHRHGFQELDQAEVFKGSAKWIRKVTDISRIDQYLDMAVIAATSGRPGPAVLNIPQDVFLKPVGVPRSRSRSLGYYPLDRPRAAQADVEAAAEIILAADNTLVMAGGGAISSSAQNEIAELQEKIGLPVLTTSMGKGAVDETHPLSLGVYSYFTNHRARGRYMTPIVKSADVVLMIGTRTNFNATEGWTHFPEDATFIHLDIDPEEIGHNYESLRLTGDAKAVLWDLIDTLAGGDLSKRKDARAGLEQCIADAKARHQAEINDVIMSNAPLIRPERVMFELAKRMTPETIICTDSSYSAIWPWNYLDCLKPGQRFITPRGLAGLGWGFPLAIGIRVAEPERPLICIVGDGGFGHCWSELETVVRMGMKFVTIVLNNGILGNQKHAENVRYGGYTDVCNFAPVDHAKIAEACGWTGVRVESPDRIGEALDQALVADGPVLIEIICDENAYPPLNMYGDAPHELIVKA